jgi:cytochrome c5
MSNPRAAVLGIAALLFATSIVSVRVQGQSAPAPVPVRATTPAPATTEQQKALINQYCVTCHSARLKTANLSLQDVDFTRIGEHAELWEKVVRKASRRRHATARCRSSCAG